MGFFVFCASRLLICGGLGKIEWVSNVFTIRIQQSAIRIWNASEQLKGEGG